VKIFFALLGSIKNFFFPFKEPHQYSEDFFWLLGLPEPHQGFFFCCQVAPTNKAKGFFALGLPEHERN
jgi:hypothetical protein